MRKSIDTSLDRFYEGKKLKELIYIGSGHGDMHKGYYKTNSSEFGSFIKAYLNSLEKEHLIKNVPCAESGYAYYTLTKKGIQVYDRILSAFMERKSRKK